MIRGCAAARGLGLVAVICSSLLSAAPLRAAEQVALAVADFDYVDSSGEVEDQSAAHAQRVAEFARLLRDRLSASGKYRVVAMDCPRPRCSAGALDAATLTGAAGQSGARLLLYGGIHKMSTLIQFGKAQMVDLQTGKVVFDRMISFRGDNEEAWTRAAEFLANELTETNVPAQQ
jgi:hypothetical protein